MANARRRSRFGATARSRVVKTNPGHPALFATTHWSVILAASQPDAPGHRAALEHLCRAYWFPIYAFIRRRGVAPADAEDCTQEFFTRLLAKEWLAGIEENGVRFRAFLLTAVLRFLANEHDRKTAAKRGGGTVMLDLDDAEARFQSESANGESAETAYDRHWALAVMDTALRQLREEATTSRRAENFELLSPFLSREAEPGEYEAIAPKLGMNAGALGVAVYRLRRRYREIVRSLISETVARPDEVDAELRYLVEVLRGL